MIEFFKRVWRAIRNAETRAEAELRDALSQMRFRYELEISRLRSLVQNTEARAKADVFELQTKLTEAEAKIAELEARGRNIITGNLRK